jgi:hypothetical protein
LRKVAYLLFLLPSLLFADEVYLKGGGSFSGRIEEQTSTMITMNIGDGVVGIATSRVERIVKGRSPLDEYDERAGKLQPQDVDGWRNLGRWASHQGLSAQSRQAYEHVVAVATGDAEARQALGFVQVDGRWLTEEEGYRARGFVKYDGEWMTDAAAQAARASDAADQARQDAERDANLAKADAIQADAQAEKAEERARMAEASDSWSNLNNPVYWGGWGFGVTGWPSTATVTRGPVYGTSQPPAQGPR